MKKLCLLAASLSCAGMASAQSTVTLFGVLDATVQRVGGSTASVTRLGSSGLANSRLGFRGREDLGGGMAASFWLEAQVNPDNGTGLPSNTNNQTSGAASCAVTTTTTTTTTATPAVAGTTLASNSTSTSTCTPALNGAQGLVFHRRSTVSLESPWGELRFGRDFASHFVNTAVYDPFGDVGVGAAQFFNTNQWGPAGIRFSNMVGYYLPPKLFGGLFGQVQYAFGENASNAINAHDGNGYSARLGYGTDDWDIAASYGKIEYRQAAGATATALGTGDIRIMNLAASYKFGNTRLMGELYRDRVESSFTRTGKGYVFGGVSSFGPHEVRYAISSFKTDAAGSPKTDKLALGYVYNLSKRTALYTTVARVKNSGGASSTVFGASGAASGGAVNAVNASASGFDLGVRHSF